jgi:hypothetical protein
MATEYDGHWKEAMERFFDRFLAFFFPRAHAAGDWAAGYESLDTELRKLLPEAALGKRISDALVKVPKKNGNGGDLRYLHVEVQCQRENDFPDRVDTYNHRFKERYNHPIISLVVLGDDDPDWRPFQYLFDDLGFRKEVTFPGVKLLDYLGRFDELERDANPIAVLVEAHLITLTTSAESPERPEGKLRLFRNLIGRRMDTEETAQFMRLVDWLVPLPKEAQVRVWQEVERILEENHMPFMSYPEQRGWEKGLQQGLLKAIELGLKLKFGSEGLALLPDIQRHTGPAFLESLYQALETATTLEDIRRLLPAP